MTAPTAAEWREAVEGVLSCTCLAVVDPMSEAPQHSEGCLTADAPAVLTALRPLIERLERALDAATVRLRAADSLADAVAAHVKGRHLGERSLALSHPRPAPGKVVALVEEFKYKAGLLRATAPTTDGTDRIVGRTWAAAAELLARALGMEEKGGDSGVT